MGSVARRLGLLAVFLAVGLMVSGCDKCGDWFGGPGAALQACKK